MKKLFILVLMVLVGIGLGLNNTKADETRTIIHRFKACTDETSVKTGGAILYRITGYASGAAAIFGIYDVASFVDSATTNCAVEGGEATSGDPLPHYNFGEEGLSLGTGLSVVVYNCTVVVEYL